LATVSGCTDRDDGAMPSGTVQLAYLPSDWRVAVNSREHLTRYSNA